MFLRAWVDCGAKAHLRQARAYVKSTNSGARRVRSRLKNILPADAECLTLTHAAAPVATLLHKPYARDCQNIITQVSTGCRKHPTCAFDLRRAAPVVQTPKSNRVNPEQHSLRQSAEPGLSAGAAY